jgi:uncharacterized protein (TIGR02611 family)
VSAAAEASRDLARARVEHHRARGRERSLPARALLALLGVALFVVSLPLVIVLPEAGIPALLLGLRLLAVEFDWAARAFTWVTWRWTQLLGWFHEQPAGVRSTIVVALAGVAILVLWLLVKELG